jgi:hypothetical protein
MFLLPCLVLFTLFVLSQSILFLFLFVCVFSIGHFRLMAHSFRANP